MCVLGRGGGALERPWRGGGGLLKKGVWQNSVKGMRTCIDLQIFTSTNVNLYNQLHQLYTLLQINHFYLQYVVKDYSSIMFQY